MPTTTPSVPKGEQVHLSTSDTDVVVVDGFESLGTNSKLHWYAAPDSWQLLEGVDEGGGGSWQILDTSTSSLSDSVASTASISSATGSQLVIRPPSKKDFWRKTFYDPILVKDDGPILYAQLQLDCHYTIETSFTLKASTDSQFDQAGIMIRIDHEHWIKTGIEVVESKPRLSVVVTNSYSDWSTCQWKQFSTSPDTHSIQAPAKIRVHCRGNNFVVESLMEGALESKELSWEFVRICHLSPHLQIRADKDPLSQHPTLQTSWQGPDPQPGAFWAGVFAACPQKAGAVATFHTFTVTKGSYFEHNADGNHEP